MNRRHKIPSYRLHKQSGQAVVTLVSSAGRRKDVLLGAYDSPASHAEYARVIGEWTGSNRRLPMEATTSLSVNELILAFWRFAENHYRHPNGMPTGELDNFRDSLRLLKGLYGHTIAANFGPLALKAIRQRMIDDGLSRRVINSRIGRIKHVFRHGVSEELIPSSTYEALRTVSGLSRGRSEARETEPILPVASADPDLDAPLFSPRDAMIGLWDEQRRNRKSKVYKQRDRTKRLATFNDHYEAPELDRAIYRACDRAGIKRWAANRLRHLHATEIRRQFGIEAASVALGHHRVETTQIYAERDGELAKRIAAAIG